MRNSKKFAALLCASVLILTASACSGGGDGSAQNSKSSDVTVSSAESAQSESSTESSTENSTESSAESSAEESSKVPAEDTLDWEYREVAKPEVKNAVCTTRPGSEYHSKEIYTAAPEPAFDFEKAKETIKKDPMFADLEFVDVETEEQYFQKSTSDTHSFKPKKEVYFVGYDADLEDIKSEYTKRVFTPSGTSYKVSLSTQQDYDLYDLPSEYRFDFEGANLTQEDVFNKAKTIFDEKTAEFMIYQPSDSKYNDETRNFMEETVKTPDGKQSYRFKRSIRKRDNVTSVSLTVSFHDGHAGEYYCMTYTPMEWAVPLSKMLETDVGGTEYRKPENFFDRFFTSESKSMKYLYSVIETEQYDQAKFSDGTIAESFFLRGARIPDDGEDHDHAALGALPSGGKFEIEGVLRLNSDSSINLYDFRMMLPVCSFTAKDIDKALVDELNVTCQKHLADLMKIDAKVFDGCSHYGDDKVSNDIQTKYDNMIYTDQIPLRIFGTEFSAELHCIASSELSLAGTDNQEAEYSARIIVGDI